MLDNKLKEITDFSRLNSRSRNPTKLGQIFTEQ